MRRACVSKKKQCRRPPFAFTKQSKPPTVGRWRRRRFSDGGGGSGDGDGSGGGSGGVSDKFERFTQSVVLQTNTNAHMQARALASPRLHMLLVPLEASFFVCVRRAASMYILYYKRRRQRKQTASICARARAVCFSPYAATGPRLCQRAARGDDYSNMRAALIAAHFVFAPEYEHSLPNALLKAGFCVQVASCLAFSWPNDVYSRFIFLFRFELLVGKQAAHRFAHDTRLANEERTIDESRRRRMSEKCRRRRLRPPIRSSMDLRI